MHAYATERGADAREQLGDAEGLDHVVVAAELETAHAVFFLAFGGDQEHGHPRVALAQKPQDLEAVFLRQHDVEQDEVGALAFRHLEARVAVLGDEHAVAFRLERQGQRKSQVLVVLDDEDGLFGQGTFRAHDAFSIVTRMRAPPSGALPRATWPPCARAAPFTSERPRPTPSVA